MAEYKQPCIHCGGFIERDSRFCPKCGSMSPFGYHCPQCLKAVEKGQAICRSSRLHVRVSVEERMICGECQTPRHA